MDYMFWVWLGVIAVTAIVEFATMDMTSIWFSLGAIPSLIMAGVGGVRWEIQIAVFVALSAVLILCLRKVAKKLLIKNLSEKTNLDAQVGKKYKLISSITEDAPGSIKINGVVWSAVSESEQKIEKDSYVEVVKVDGNKMVVKPVVEEEK